MHGFSQMTNSILVKHDTTVLQPPESEWIIKSLTKNNPVLTSEIGKSLPLLILQLIEKGKVKAIDPQTNKTIPAAKIYTWNIGVETMEVYDDNGNTTHKAIQRLRSSNDIKQIRVYQDWFFNVATGKLTSQIKWLELVEEVKSPSTGIVLGNNPLCRIYY